METDTRSGYTPDAHARLQAVNEFDPDDLFRANHRISAEEALGTAGYFAR